MGSQSSILEDRSDETMHMVSQSLIPECRCDRPFSKPQIRLARFLRCLYSHTRTQDSIAIPAQGAGGIFLGGERGETILKGDPGIFENAQEEKGDARAMSDG